MRDITYPPIIVTAKRLFRALGLRFQMSGTEHVPRSGGALLAFNHVVLHRLRARRVRRAPLASTGAVHGQAGGLRPPVDRAGDALACTTSRWTAPTEGLRGRGAALPRAGEVVGIFPEATISRSFEVKELKSGATRIAAPGGRARSSPSTLWGTQRMMTKDHPRDFSRGKTIGIRVGEPMYPTGDDPVAETAELQERLARRCSTRRSTTTRAEEQPPGAWWLPASRGGSAPTPERAAELDAEEKGPGGRGPHDAPGQTRSPAPTTDERPSRRRPGRT